MLRLFLVTISVLIYASQAQIMAPASRISSGFQGTEQLITGLMVASGDIAAVTSIDQLIVYKRDSNGMYGVINAVNFTNNENPNALSMNSEWIGLSCDYGIQHLYRRNSTGNIEDTPYTLNMESADYYYTVGKLMPDGSYVVISLNDAIYTYNFIENFGWNETRKDLPPNFIDIKQPPYYDFSIALHDDYFVIARSTSDSEIDDAEFFLYVRSNNATWNLEAQVNGTLYISMGMSAIYDGPGKTLFVGGMTNPQAYPAGEVKVYNKINNEWKLTQTMRALDLGLTGAAFFGIGMLQVDSETILVNAPYEGVVNIQAFRGGAIYWFKRNETGFLTPYLEARSNSTGVYGAAPALLDQNQFLAFDCDVNATSGEITCYISSMQETCVLEPTSVSCHDSNTVSCGNFDLDIDSLYTVNTPQRCGQVTASYSDLRGTGSDGFEVDLTFTRQGHADVTCTVKIACEDKQVTSNATNTVVAQLLLLAVIVGALML